MTYDLKSNVASFDKRWFGFRIYLVKVSLISAI